MVDRPVIFSGAMVLALLADRKTQTRRIPRAAITAKLEQAGDKLLARYPHQKGTGWEIGDILWVREAITRSGALVQYCADGHTTRLMWPDKWKNDPQPAMFMPRAFSRLTLTVTDVRVQRLGEISEDDAVDEGIEPIASRPTGEGHYRVMIGEKWNYEDSAVRLFMMLWNSLHGAAADFANPWICALTFTVARHNIDA